MEQKFQPLIKQNVFKLSHQNPIIQLIKSNNLICSQSNKAINLCINKICNQSNPFICSKNQCFCHINHNKCQQKNIQTYLKIFSDNQKVTTKIQQLINTQTDDVIKTLNQHRNNLIQKVNKYNWLYNKCNISKIQLNQQNMNDNQIAMKNKPSNSAILMTDINSKLLSTMWNLSKQIDKSIQQKQIQKRLRHFSYPAINQVQKCMNKFDKYIQLISQNKGKCYWDPVNSAQNYIIEDNKITLKNKKKSNYVWSTEYHKQPQQFAVIYPSLDEIKGSRISWKIKIIKASTRIGVGICMKNVVRQNHIKPLQYENINHGGYIRDNCVIEYINGQQVFKRNSKQTFGQGQTLWMSYDKQKRILKINSIQIVIPQCKQDEYCICVSLASPQDIVQLIPPIVVIQDNIINQIY